MSHQEQFTRVHSHVWCDVHGDVHERSTNPHDMEKPECSKEHWRELYVWATHGEVYRNYFNYLGPRSITPRTRT